MAVLRGVNDTRIPAIVAITSFWISLASLLERANLQPLASVDGLASRSLEELCATYSEKGRTGFISHSKELGVSTLGERQKLAQQAAAAWTQRGLADPDHAHDAGDAAHPRRRPDPAGLGRESRIWTPGFPSL